MKTAAYYMQQEVKIRLYVNTGCNKTESSLLHLVSMTVNCLEELAVVPVVYLLSNAGLDLDVVDKNDFTPLQLAIKLVIFLPNYLLIIFFCLCVSLADDNCVQHYMKCHFTTLLISI